MMKLMAMQAAMPDRRRLPPDRRRDQGDHELARSGTDPKVLRKIVPGERARSSGEWAHVAAARWLACQSRCVTYARGRRIVDADSHLMEWPDFLTEHADPAFRDAMPPIGGGRSGLTLTDGEPARRRARGLEALGDDLVRKGPKWHAALGAVDPSERSTRPRPARLRAPGRVLIAVRAAVRHPGSRPALRRLPRPQPRRGVVLRRRRAAARRRHVRSRRRRPVPPHSSSDALDLGLREVWLPARAPGGRAPGHVDHDPFWARLAEREVPFVLHVGSGPLGIGDAWLDNGRPLAEEMTGAEIIGSKDFMVVYQTAERFLSVLVLDGVLERHPGLHGGAIEMGAGWVPAMLRRLDHAVQIWQRSEPRLGTFQRTPSEQAAAQLRFTPYPFEDVGWLVAQSDPSLYLFSSDYPHAEGGRDPLGRFDRSLAAASPGDDRRVLRRQRHVLARARLRRLRYGDRRHGRPVVVVGAWDGPRGSGRDEEPRRRAVGYRAGLEGPGDRRRRAQGGRGHRAPGRPPGCATATSTSSPATWCRRRRCSR